MGEEIGKLGIKYLVVTNDVDKNELDISNGVVDFVDCWMIFEVKM